MSNTHYTVHHTHAPASFVKGFTFYHFGFYQSRLFYARADNVKIYITGKTVTWRITFLQGGETGGQLMNQLINQFAIQGNQYAPREREA